MLLIRPSQAQLIERALALVEEGSEHTASSTRRSASRWACWADRRARARRSPAQRRSRVELGLPRLELDVLRFSQYVIGFQLELEEAVEHW